MKETLAQITAERRDPAGRFTGFCVGIVLWDDVVIEADGVVKYMKRWTRARVRDYCVEKGWTVSVVHELERARP